MRSDRLTEPEELRRLLTPDEGDRPAGPLLYRENGRSWVAADEGHTLYLGKSGSGKTRSGVVHLIRSFYRAGESFTLIDPKGELLRLTGGLADSRYDVHVVNGRDLFRSEGWNPLAEIRRLYVSGDPEQKYRASRSLKELAFELYPDEKGEDQFWISSARSLFMGLCYAVMDCAEAEEVNLRSVYRLAVQQGSGLVRNKAVRQVTEELPKDSPGVLLLQNYLTTAADTAAGILSWMLEGLAPFVDSDAVSRLTCGRDLQICALSADKPTAIYIVVPDESPVFDRVAGVLCGQILRHYLQMADESFGGRLPRRMNLCIEELGNVRFLSNLPHLMSAARSRNIRCQLVLNSLSQLTSLYGQASADTILANVETIVAFRTNHRETLQELQQLCGVRSTEQGTEPLVTMSQLSAMETGQALVLLGGGVRFFSWLPDVSRLPDGGACPLLRQYGGSAEEAVRVFDAEAWVKSRAGDRLEKAIASRHSAEPFPWKEPEALPGEDGEAEVQILEVLGRRETVAQALRRHTQLPLLQCRKALEALPYTVTFPSKRAAKAAEADLNRAGAVTVSDD